MSQPKVPPKVSPKDKMPVAVQQVSSSSKSNNTTRNKESFQLNDKSLSDSAKLTNAINYLKGFSTNPRFTIDDKMAYEAFFLVATLVRDDATTVLDSKCENFYGQILLELYTLSPQIDFTNFIVNPEIQSSNHLSPNEHRLALIALVLSTVNVLTIKSVEFCSKFAAQNGLQAHLAFLTDERLRSKIMNVRIHFHFEYELIDYLVTNLGVMSRCYEMNTTIWLNTNIVDVLILLVKMNPKTELSAYYSICNISSDAQIETLAELHTVIVVFCQLASQCANNLKKGGEDLVRREIEILDSASEGYTRTIKGEVVSIFLDSGYWASVLFFLTGLYKLSVNDKLRLEIYFTNKMNDVLGVFLAKGNDIEQLLALKLLCQLSFNEKIAEEIGKNKELVIYLNTDNTQDMVGIGSFKKTILWNLRVNESNILLAKKIIDDIKLDDIRLANDVLQEFTNEKVDDDLIKKKRSRPKKIPKTKDESLKAHKFEKDEFGFENEDLRQKAEESKKEVKESDKSSIASDGRHVMISYNTGSRELCLKVKSELESQGHKVWIDVSDIHGSSLESMANAVENSYCVLICVTEKYRQSPNCQAEAQYAFRLRKPIIPLIMEAGFEDVRGWLGIIMGDKIFINFIKKKYEECIERLKGEISSYLNGNLIDNTTTAVVANTAKVIANNNPTLTAAKTNNVEAWSEDDVKQWFMTNSVDANIMEAILPCKGSILKQLFSMKQTASEFYFQALNKNKNVELKSMLDFNEKMDKLFQN